MCYSVQVQKDLKKIKEEFQIEISWNDDEYSNNKILAQDKNFLKNVLGLKRKPIADFFKEESDGDRIWPKQFAPVIVKENNQYYFKHMRFGLWPSNSKTMPEKDYYNARSETINLTYPWERVFFKNHALLPFQAFFEQVPHGDKTREISFRPKGRDLMWAPCIYDKWVDTKTGFSFYSFALITREPYPDVLSQGHDRSPLFLKKEYIENWLNPSKHKKNEILEFLKKSEDVTFNHFWPDTMSKKASKDSDFFQLHLFDD